MPTDDEMEIDRLKGQANALDENGNIRRLSDSVKAYKEENKDIGLSSFNNNLPENEQVKRMGDKYFDNRGNIATLVTTKSDADYAQELKRRIIDSYGPFLEILTEAKKHGFEIQMQSGANPVSNEVMITSLNIIKVY